MLLKMLHSKIHRATVTESDLHYEGSLGIDRAFLKTTGMIPGQQIDVLNVSNGERFTTYIIEEPEGSKKIGVYGAAAHRAGKGDVVIIIAYAMMDEAEATRYKAPVLILGPGNEVANG
jgi:aspartate 1-decarboxylase